MNNQPFKIFKICRNIIKLNHLNLSIQAFISLFYRSADPLQFLDFLTYASIQKALLYLRFESSQFLSLIAFRLLCWHQLSNRRHDIYNILDG